MKQGLLLGLSVANVLLSAGLQFVPLVFFGAGLTVDAFVAALMVPSVIMSMSAVVVTYSLVPQLAALDASAQGALVRRAFVAVSAFIGLPTLALIVLASFWVPWTVPGFPAEQVPATVELVRISLAASLASVYALVLSARMQANSEFILNALAAVLAAGVATAFAISAIGPFGIVAAAWSLLMKSIIQFGIAWAIHPPAIRARSSATIVIGRRAAPLLVSSAVSKLEPIVDRTLLTSAPPGLLTLFYLAQQIYGAMSQVASGSVLAHVLTRFSTAARIGRANSVWPAVRGELRRACVVAIVFWMMLMVAVFAGWKSGLLAYVLPEAELEKLAVLILAMAGVWVFGLTGLVLSSSFYARGNTVTPSVVAVIGFVAAIILKLAGFSVAGPVGLAVANSLYLFLTSAGMFILIRMQHLRGVE